MGIISRAADTYYTYRLLRTLATKWTDQEAYTLGIIDENGKVLRRANTLRTSEEKSAYSLFHRLSFNLKRILEALPFGKSRLANFAAALFLIREEAQLSQSQLEDILSKFEIEFGDDILESNWNMIDDNVLSPGEYILTQDVASPVTGEYIAKQGSKIIADVKCEAVDNIFGIPIFEVNHIATKTKIYVSPKDISR